MPLVEVVVGADQSDPRRGHVDRLLEPARELHTGRGPALARHHLRGDGPPPDHRQLSHAPLPRTSPATAAGRRTRSADARSPPQEHRRGACLLHQRGVVGLRQVHEPPIVPEVHGQQLRMRVELQPPHDQPVEVLAQEIRQVERERVVLVHRGERIDAGEEPVAVVPRQPFDAMGRADLDRARRRSRSPRTPRTSRRTRPDASASASFASTLRGDLTWRVVELARQALQRDVGPAVQARSRRAPRGRSRRTRRPARDRTARPPRPRTSTSSSSSRGGTAGHHQGLGGLGGDGGVAAIRVGAHRLAELLVQAARRRPARCSRRGCPARPSCRSRPSCTASSW